jgi:hypothetical protein
MEVKPLIRDLIGNSGSLKYYGRMGENVGGIEGQSA